MRVCKTPKRKNPPCGGIFVGAVEKTRTSTGCPTATSTLRVYQFRHDRIVVAPDRVRRRSMYQKDSCHTRAGMNIFVVITDADFSGSVRRSHRACDLQKLLIFST